MHPTAKPPTSTAAKSSNRLETVSRELAAPAILLAAAAAILSAVLSQNGGVLAYALDDAYIHLALSEQIAQGHYGLAAAAPSSPASSILYPFLLAPFAAFPFHAWAPLVINALALAATAVVLSRLLAEAEIGGSDAVGLRAAMSVVIIAAVHGVGLVFSGMEHSLQMLLAVAVLYGLVIEARRGVPPSFLWVVIAVGPLVRYEALAPSLAAVAVLALRGHVRVAIQGAVGALAPVVAFSGFLVSEGLPALPSSVLHKSLLGRAEGPADWPGLMIDNATSWGSVSSGPMVLLGCMTLASLLLVMPSGSERRSPLSLVAFGWACVLAHLAVGSFGWFQRYEAYVLVLAVTIASLAVAPFLKLERRVSGRWALVAWSVAVLALCHDYVGETLRAPSACHNIYEQQYQMHRFAVDFWKDDVAVNDIGWVSYRNPFGVLDLTGLASEAVRRKQVATARGATTRRQWVPELIDDTGIGLAMVADPAGPRDYWDLRARLELGGPRVTSFLSSVSFYATDPARRRSLDAKLDAFEQTLPGEVRLVRPAREPRRPGG